MMETTTAPTHRSIAKAWIEAMRLRTLPVSVAGVIAGTSCAIWEQHFRWLPFIICMLFAIGAQVASNFANEYYDFRNGLDRKGREGFRRGVTEGDITPQAMRNATFGLLIFVSLLGCALIPYGGWILVPVGIAIALFALGYSTGPFPLSHNGLGDIAVIIFFGFVPVTFTNYVESGLWSWDSIAVPISIAIGLMAANVLIVNNYRDMEDDKAVGKRTTVVLLGRRFMAGTYLLFGLGAQAITICALWGRLSPLWLIAPGIIAVGYLRLYYLLTLRRGSPLNPVLGMTAMLLLLASLLLLAAMILSPRHF